MASPYIVSADALGRALAPNGFHRDQTETAASAVSWGAIFAGAAAAAALSLILFILGTGLGLSSVSPWSQNGIGATAFGVSTILWVTLTQVAASGMGGYLAGRLRTKWQSVATDEIYFRDTAHGFLAWAIASLATATLLASVIGSIVSGGVQAGASVAGGLASSATSAAVAGSGTETARSPADSGLMPYLVDTLFRRDRGMPTATSATPANTGTATQGTPDSTASSSEVIRIFATSIRAGALSADDLRYVSQLVAERSGLPQAEAEKRVGTTFARAQSTLRDAELAAKEAADKARKASAYVALWLFISLLVGAFVASFAATYGGRQRDL